MPSSPIRKIPERAEGALPGAAARAPRRASAVAPFLPVLLALLLSALLVLPPSLAGQDTVEVRADGPPAWGARLQLVEELRIGTLEGPEEQMFGRVAHTAVTPDGTIWVEDSQVPVVRRWAADGAYLGTVGREGEGPGEYLRLQGMRPMPDGGVATWDPRNARISVFDEDGAFVTSHRAPSGLFSAEVFQVDTAGIFQVRTITNRPEDPGDDRSYGWIRVSPEGEVLDTVPIPPARQVGGGFVLATNQGYMRPFPIETLSSPSPHGYLVTGRNDTYAFHRPLPDGRVLRVVRDYDPVPVQREERAQWDAFRRAFEEAARAQGSPGQYGPIPSEKPPFQWIWTDDEGRVWVSRYVEAEYRPLSPEARAERGDRPALEWRQPPVFDVFEPDGTFLGRVTLPRDTRVVAARGMRVWTVQAGEFGEGYVVRFRIEPDGG